MNEAEILRIGNEAAEEEPKTEAQEGSQVKRDISGAVVEEFAATLDLLAKIGGKALPSVPVHFNHVANLDIAKAAAELCAFYGYDPKTFLLGEDSPLGRWLGLGFAIGFPAYACYQDFTVMRAKEVKQEAAEDGNG